VSMAETKTSVLSLIHQGQNSEHFRELNVKILGAIVAFEQAGFPEPETALTPFHSYEGDWKKRVRHLCVWLGLGDPCKGRERIQARDDDKDFLRVLFGAILSAQGRAGTRAPMAAGKIASLPELKGIFPDTLLDRDGRAGSAFGKELVRLSGRDGVRGTPIAIDGTTYSLQMTKSMGRPAYFVEAVKP